MLRKEKKNKSKYILGLFIVVLMASSALALFGGGGNSGGNGGLSYNDYDFYLQSGKYLSTIDGVAYSFDFLPGDVEDMSFEVYPFSTDRVYIDSESLDVVPKLELAFANKGFLPISEARECDSGNVVIKVIDGEDNKIYIDNACIVLEGNPFKTSDRLIYWLLGVI